MINETPLEESLAPNSPKHSRWSRVVTGLCLVYASSVLSFLAIRAVLPAMPPPLTLVNSFLPFLFAPLLLTLPLALLLRSRTAILGSLAVLLTFWAHYSPFFLPRIDSSVPRTDIKVRLMTFNLRYDHSRPRQLIGAIESEDADIVAVQELNPFTAHLLSEGLKDRFPYTILRLGVSNTGLLSRHPILESEPFQTGEGSRTALHAVVDLNGTPVHIFVVHLRAPGRASYEALPLPIGLDDGAQKREASFLAQRAAGLQEPVLLMGDLNTTDQSPAYARLSSVLKDAFREAGWGFGFTFPNGLRPRGLPLPGPLVRIDYILHSDHFYAEWARVGCGGGSDHCYLAAELTQISLPIAEAWSDTGG